MIRDTTRTRARIHSINQLGAFSSTRDEAIDSANLQSLIVSDFNQRAYLTTTGTEARRGGTPLSSATTTRCAELPFIYLRLLKEKRVEEQYDGGVRLTQ